MENNRSNDEGQDLTSIDNLPIDVLLKIFSNLTPEDVSSVTQVNRLFHHVGDEKSKRTQRFWREKFELHFPRVWPDNADEKNFNWYNAFKETYEHQYKKLSPRMRQFFSAIKENDLDLLKRYHETKPFTIRNILTRDASYWRPIDDDGRLDQDIRDFFYDAIILPYYENYSTPNSVTYEDTGLTLLLWAARLNQKPDYIRQLLVDGAVLNASALGFDTALSMAAECGHSEVVKVLLDSEENNLGSLNQALFGAALGGHLDVVKVLLANDVTNVNATAGADLTPLIAAATNGHVEVVRIILAHEGVQVNYSSTNEYFSGSALHGAITNSRKEVTELLLGHDNINVNEVNNDGATALHIAVATNQLDAVKALLLHKNLDVHAVRADGATALSIAVKQGQPEIVKALKIELLERYIAERGREDAPMYKTSKSFFGKKVDFGYSKDQKVNAAIAKLKELKGEAGSVSDEDEKILNQGTTKTIVNPKVNRRR